MFWSLFSFDGRTNSPRSIINGANRNWHRKKCVGRQCQHGNKIYKHSICEFFIETWHIMLTKKVINQTSPLPLILINARDRHRKPEPFVHFHYHRSGHFSVYQSSMFTIYNNTVWWVGSALCMGPGEHILQINKSSCSWKFIKLFGCQRGSWYYGR